MSIRRLKRMVNKPARAHFMIDLTALQEALRLIDREDWIGAQHLLVELNRKSPNLEEILAPLALTHYHLNELPAYLTLCIQLGRLTPDDPENQLALAHAYLMNGRPALARVHFQKFLERWPDHEEAVRAREHLAKLETSLGPILREMDLTGEDAFELAALHEESQILMEAGKYRQGIAKAQELLRRKPNYASSLNNISMMQFSLGELPEAIATAERVRASAPDNFYALGNLVHFLTAAGREAEARAHADRLKRVENNSYDRWIKQAEACAAIGDDAGVLDALQGLEKRGPVDTAIMGFYVYHLAAVASLRLGREDEARAFWRKCFAISPAFSLAQENLADLNDSPRRRNGPWSFPFSHWVPWPLVNDFSDEHRRAEKRREKDMGPAMKRFLSKRPHILPLLPILLDRGDPAGRDFAVTLASFLRTPEAIAMLREFGLGEKGTDALRLQALSKALALSGGDLAVLPVWPKGPDEQTRLRIVEIYFEAEPTFSLDAQALYEEAFELLNALDGLRAEPLLKQALALAPNSPQLLNNLAMAYQLQDRSKEAQALVREIREKYPDYLFGRTNLANQLIHRKKYEEAFDLLRPLDEQHRLHFSEAAALYNLWILFLSTRGDLASARLWLEIFERVAPTDIHIADWHERLAKTERQSELSSLLASIREQLPT